MKVGWFSIPAPGGILLLVLAGSALAGNPDSLANKVSEPLHTSIHALKAGTRLFSSRTLEPPSLATLGEGEEVTLKKVDWAACQVETAEGRTGWIQTEELAWVHWYPEGIKSVERIHGGIVGRGRDIFPGIRRHPDSLKSIKSITAIKVDSAAAQRPR